MHLRFLKRFLAAILAVMPLVCAAAGAEEALPSPPYTIKGLDNAAGDSKGDPILGLRDDLYVRLNAMSHVDPTGYLLSLDGNPIKGLTARYDEERHALYFRLERLEDKEHDNRAAWVRVLGAPYSLTRLVRVDVIPPKAADGRDPVPLDYEGGGRPELKLILVRPNFVWASFLGLLAVVWSIVRWGSKTTLLRDGTITSMPLKKRMYSLARSQMAFWFILILAPYLFIFAVTWDYNSLTGQTLALMGIASATALGAVAIDSNKDTADIAAVRKAEGDVAREAGFAVDSPDALDRAVARANDAATPNAAALRVALKAYDTAIEPFTTKGSW